MIYFKKYIFTRYFINISFVFYFYSRDLMIYSKFIIIKNKITRTLR